MVENEEKIIRWNYPGKNAQPGQFRAHYFPKENSPPSSRGKDPRCEGKPLRNWNNERDFVRSFRRVKEGEERNDFSNWRKEASKRHSSSFPNLFVIRYIEREIDFITIESSKDVLVNSSQEFLFYSQIYTYSRDTLDTDFEK